MNLKKTFLKIITIVLLFFINISFAFGLTESELKQQIEQYEKELSKLSGQSKTLSNQIAQFDAQIKLTTLKIQDSEQKISMLGGRITELESSLDSLSTAFISRAVETYKMSRFENGIFFVLNTNSIDDAFSRLFYLKKIQESDRELMEKMQKAQTLYITEKEDEETLQKKLESQKAELDSQKRAKASLLSITKNDEKRYQQLLADAKAQLAAFSRFVSGRGGATILNGTTKDDPGWGKYYNQRDSLWGNKPLGRSNISVADAGCLITSMSMIMTYYGKSVVPGDIAANSDYFSPYDPYADFKQGTLIINGSTTTRTRIGYSQSSLDNELSAGKPVILGVSPYGSQKPEHFIVVKRKEGNDYVINDPFIENGMNAKLSSHYSLSSIRTVDRVTVN